MAYQITITDLETGETESYIHQNLERLVQSGELRVDTGGPGTSMLVDTAVTTLMIKAFTGNIETYEDFVNFVDETGGEPGGQ